MLKKQIVEFLETYRSMKASDQLPEGIGKIPGGYLKGNQIYIEPSDEGDCRYPYGEDGFNFWTYGSGYMHCNEGLFSPFLRSTEGGEPKIAFFVGKKGQDYRFSCLSVPVIAGEPESLERFTVLTPECSYYFTDTDEVTAVVKAFVKGKNICFDWILVNKTGSPSTFYLTSYLNPFLKNALVENSTDRWFREVRYDGTARQFEIETYEEKDRGIMSTNYGVVKYGLAVDGKVISNQALLKENDSESVDYVDVIKSSLQTTSRYEYVGGTRSSLHSAKVLKFGELSGTKLSSSFTETAICGDLLEVTFDESLSYKVEISYTTDEDEIEQYRNASIDFAAFQQDEEMREYDKTLSFRFKDGHGPKGDVLNPFMTHLKKQVAFCSEIKGFVQLSHFSLIGIRDIFQALEGYMFYEPEKAKLKMLEALSFTSPEGQLPRQYSLPVAEGARPAMDLRPFIDQGVWVISTIVNYLRLTKDFGFLNEKCGYYEFVDEHRHIAEKTDRYDSVLQHMVLIMDYLIKNRDHDFTKCVLALYGDWNDALDGLGKSIDPDKEYGTGVSVMVTLQVYQNLCEMIDLMSLESVTYENKQDLIEIYKKVKEEILEGLQEHAIDRDRIIHGWGDQKSYLVGSNCDPDGVARDGLTSNAFWILSGLHKDDSDYPVHREMILNGFSRLDSKYGMKTFEPYFEKGTTGVGRIPNLPKGTAENGATYIHASMFGVMALFAMGESKKAWDELYRLLPFTHESVSVSPFVLPNSYGLNEEFGIDGESMQDWQTGSSNVLLKTIIRFVFGFEPVMDGVIIGPPNYQPFREQTMSLEYQGKNVTITHRLLSVDTSESEEGQAMLGSNTSTERRFTVNGQVMKGSKDAYMKVDRLTISDEMLDMFGRDITILVEDE